VSEFWGDKVILRECVCFSLPRIIIIITSFYENRIFSMKNQMSCFVKEGEPKMIV